ncbi:MAG: single-stranded DNA-binding protein [Candidatus Cloacimonadota bacterium]|nr:MAG: single-stranded DNA-binding protein [Candidatus Cloacimonadota bacterium]
MASFNKVMFMGNLTRDPELRYTPGGLAVCNFDIAVNSSFKSQKDDGKDETLFIRITTFNKQAENCGQYLKKGRPVFVEGRLSISNWQGEDGVKRYRTEVIAQLVQFLGGGASEGNYSEASQETSKTVDISSIDEISDDEIPF